MTRSASEAGQSRETSWRRHASLMEHCRLPLLGTGESRASIEDAGTQRRLEFRTLARLSLETRSVRRRRGSTGGGGRCGGDLPAAPSRRGRHRPARLPLPRLRVGGGIAGSPDRSPSRGDGRPTASLVAVTASAAWASLAVCPHPRGPWSWRGSAGSLPDPAVGPARSGGPARVTAQAPRPAVPRLREPWGGHPLPQSPSEQPLPSVS